MTWDLYPISLLDDCINSPGDGTKFPTFNCKSGYWLREIAEGDQNKPPVYLVMVFSVLLACPSDRKMSLGHFNRQRMSD